jgi:hypothetical protein
MSHEYNGYEMPDTIKDVEHEIDKFDNSAYDANSWNWVWLKLILLTFRIIIAIFRSKNIPYGGE